MRMLFAILVLAGCTLQTPPSLQIHHHTDDPEFTKGSKYHGGCFKIVNKKNFNYGCTFFSSQGSMYLQDYGSSNSQWRVIWNKKIRCLSNSGALVPESDVRPFRCPEYLYH